MKEVMNKNQEELINKFLSLASVCNFQHLALCNCHNDKINKYYAEESVKTLSELDEKSPKYIIESRLHSARNEAIKRVEKECLENNVRCPIEQALIKDIIVHYDKSLSGIYDTTDTNVFIIFRSLLNQILSTHRMQLYSNEFGLMQKIVTKDGNERFVLNPVEELKNRVDSMIISSIEKLNNIVYGIKSTNINVNIEQKPLDITEVLDVEAIDSKKLTNIKKIT